MGQRYAEGTSVAVERSEAEIKALLRKHGVETYGTANDDRAGKAVVWFIYGKRVEDRRQARIQLDLPKLSDFDGVRRTTGKTIEESRRRAYEGACASTAKRGGWRGRCPLRPP